MHDNPRDPAERAFALPDLSVIELIGADAEKFAQAQFMNDVAGLVEDRWQWNGWLTPKGRVIALFALLKHADDHLQLLVLDIPASGLIQALRRFVFRSRVTIALREDLQVSGRLDAPTQARGNAFASDGAATVELDLSADGGPRALNIHPGNPAAPDESALAHWRALDLQHGLPRLSELQIEQWTPQQLSLERLRAFSVKKGCYPGQEIVARTHFLGKAKRGLALLKADAPLTVGAEVLAGENALGTLIAVAGADTSHFALAVLPLDRVSPVSSAGSVEVQEVSIKTGLAR